jgi:hypothetical protein
MTPRLVCAEGRLGPHDQVLKINSNTSFLEEECRIQL